MPALGPSQLPILGVPIPGGKAARVEAVRLHLSSAEIYTSNAPYAFMAQSLITRI
jgi:hypothetical protein